MKADPAGVLTGRHYYDGNHACCEGALAAGCRFAAGYPITPSTEVVERIAQRFPLVGGVFIQMEDEIASSITLQGAVWGGKKSLTVTSGPGFSLMMEHIGLAAIMECPCVFVDVQRGGPSTGLPTLPGQADMMQVRWGSHGDYEIIAIAPSSPQDCFDYTVDAFNLSEKYRVPVFVMMDECVGHMTERVDIPPADQIEIFPRRFTTKPKGEYLPYALGADGIPEMAKAGDGYRFHVTGLTHDERGYPVINAAAQDKKIRHIVDKIRKHTDEIVRWEDREVEGAEVVVLSYGITYRVALRGMELARARGAKVGSMRLVVCWPFPEKRVRELAAKTKALVMVEMNLGQMYFEMERAAAGKCRTVLVPHAGGTVHDPEVIANAIVEAVR
jgi:2-oxoglutarate/2-oxoacid ferredoxin oxidoreductase subunit alpha